MERNEKRRLIYLDWKAPGNGIRIRALFPPLKIL